MFTSPPRIRNGLIERPRLMHQLRRWQHLRLIRIVAPAGFGKSSLAALWLQELAQSLEIDRPLAIWVSLEPEIDSATALASHLAAAFAPIAGGALQRPTTDADAPQTVRSILQTIAENPRSIVLVFDDLHLIQNPAALALVQTLLDRCPPNLHPVILSRTPTLLNVSRLLANGDILSLTRDDLSFDHDEFAAFVKHSRLAAADPQLIQEIEMHAAGWATGLQLLAQALPASGQVRDSSAFLHAAYSDLTSFLDREIMVSMPAQLQTFLVDVSFLPLLFADLCAAVTEFTRTDCAVLLKRTAELSGLITPFDGESSDAGPCLRMHPLLRGILQDRLQRQRESEIVHAMHQRAVNWLTAHNKVEDSLSTLLASARSNIGNEPAVFFEIDGEFVTDLVHATHPTTLGLDEPSTFQRWLARLPESVIRAHPRLVLDEAWSIFYFTTPREKLYVERIKAMLAGAEFRRDPMLAAFRSEAALIDAVEAIANGRFDLALQHYESADAATIPPDSLQEGYLHVLRAFVAPGDDVGMESRLTEIYHAKEIFMRIGSLRGWVAAAYGESWIRRACTDVTTVLRNYELAYESYRQFHVQDSIHNVITHLLHADMLYYLDRITEARELLLRGMALVDGNAAMAMHRYHFMLRLEMCERASGSTVGINDAVDAEQWRTCFDGSVPFVTSSTAFLRIQRDTRLGRPDRVRQSFAAMHIIDSDPVADLPLLYRVSLLTQKVSAGRSDEPVESMLAELHTEYTRQGWTQFAMQTRVLQLIHSLRHHNEQERRDQDIVLLDELLAQVESTGLHRYVLNYPQLEPLLCLSRMPIAGLLVQRMRGAAANDAAAPFNLSSHEVRILRRLADGRSTKEIAADLTISVATVRTHLRNIFTKMNVHQRSDAINVARTAGLLDAA
jgi:LuxR family maltose regulon positive regulatory protein